MFVIAPLHSQLFIQDAKDGTKRINVLRKANDENRRKLNKFEILFNFRREY